LLQACIEPELRAWIGPDPPVTAQARGRICRVEVESSGWFAQKSIPINPGLVAIVGPRGSGKTALADVIAAGAGSTEQFANRDSFLYRAGNLLEDSGAAVEWTDGEVTKSSLSPDEPHDIEIVEPPVRYLSQQ